MPPKNTAECWVGIDVSKGWIDVFVLLEEKKAEIFRCNRTGPALAELAKKLLPYDPQGIILEATGGLEVPVITALDAAGLKVMRMNPKRVRDFANGMGFLAKTDALDAEVLAMFGARARPPWRAFPAAERQQLAAFMARQQQLTVDRAAECTRLHQATDPLLNKSVERMIAFLGNYLNHIGPPAAFIGNDGLTSMPLPPRVRRDKLLRHFGNTLKCLVTPTYKSLTPHPTTTYPMQPPKLFAAPC